MLWEKQFEIGVDFIDAQHRGWFDRVAELARAIESGQTRAAMADALRFVVEYTQKHFADEQAYMEEIRFPRLENQKNLHKKFEKHIVGVLVDLKQGKEVPAANLHQAMMDWMQQHIQEEDALIGRFLMDQHKANASSAEKTALSRQDELATPLADLADLHAAELITADDYASKKQDLLTKYATQAKPAKAGNSIDRLNRMRTYVEQGLLTEDDLNVGRGQLAQGVDVARELARKKGHKAKMMHLKQLLDEAVITEAQFETHKTEILSQI